MNISLVNILEEDNRIRARQYNKGQWLKMINGRRESSNLGNTMNQEVNKNNTTEQYKQKEKKS